MRRIVLDASITSGVETQEATLPAVARLARTTGLTIYDAVYLELAPRLDLPLGSLDEALGAAARSAGVEILTAGRSQAAPTAPVRNKAAVKVVARVAAGRCRLLFGFHAHHPGLRTDETMPHLGFSGADGITNARLVVVLRSGELAADFAEPFKAVVAGLHWIVGRGRTHGSTSSSSSGVMSCGVG